MAEPRKPVVTTAGLRPDLAKALEPVRQTLEIITGARSGIRELKALKKDAKLEDVITAVNQIMARLNSSGEAR